MKMKSKVFSIVGVLLLQMSGLATVVPAAVKEGSSSVTNRFMVDSEAKAMKYNPMIFGQFIEHFDTQVYGGIYDPKSKFADEDGFRTDVIEALKEIKMPIVRWPGGCFVSTYHWKGGVGPKRVPAYDKSWQVEDPNTFGTDEFIKWCRKIGTEPYICTNAGTGTPEEMSDWVEYCNLNIGQYGRMRKANGHAEPYNVKYWSIGNENYGAWELGARTVEEWGPMVAESAKLMRSVTKDLKLFAAATNSKSWSLPLLKKAGKYLDYMSIHGYWDPLHHYNNVTDYMGCMLRTDGPEQSIQKGIDVLEEAGYRGKIKLAFDEWNLRGWHHPWHGEIRKGFELEARRKNDINSTYTLADALFSACFLNACLRNASDVEIACFSPIVNTRGAIFVHPDGILKRTTFYTFQMCTNRLEEFVIPVKSSFECLTVGDKSTGVLDVILTANKEKSRYVCAVVNKDPEQNRTLTLDFEGMGIKAPRNVSAVVLSGKTPDDYNEVGDENRVVPQEKKMAVTDNSVTLPPHSLVFLYF